MEDYYIGIDVGGTKIEGALASLNVTDHKISVDAKKRISTTSTTIEAFISSLLDLIHDLIAEAQLTPEKIKAIGIGLPGSLDPRTKIMMNGNTRFLIGHDVLSMLCSSLDSMIPVYAQNDANLFTFAEAWGGAGLTFFKEKKIPFEEQVVVGITLGTGVGGGLVTLGKIFNGAHGSALEVGHIVLNPEGPLCYCGQRGCAEMYLSGTALNRLSDSKTLFEKAAAGDADSLQVLADYRRDLLHFLSILNNLFNPHYFVFGGGLSSQELLFVDLKNDLRKHTFLPESFCPEIYVNHLGGSSGLFGAMIYAKELLDA
ncbi:MAG: ROK family protein [Bacteriovorax sp.]|jgi:fructokinase